jgi:hypothetical protein
MFVCFSGVKMIKIDTERSEKTKRWKIPDKFINPEFADFIQNINVLKLNGKVVDKRPIKESFGSLEEWANYFQLWELHGIDLDSILKLFGEKGCGKIFIKENCFQYHHQNLAYLEEEIRARYKSE